jgi:alpha-1,2-mannosyltransferase
VNERESIARFGRTALPIVALLSLAAGLGATLAVAGDTLGYDFLAYHRAAARLLDGQPLYDMSYTQTGGFGLFYYPPTFAPMLLPFGLLSSSLATWTWIGLSVVAFLVGVAILPVSRSVRWWLVLLAGWSFPFVYAVKLGQVGPLLFLVFAVGWRCLGQPVGFGVSAAIGAALKLQPAVLVVWAVLTRRFQAALVSLAALAVLAIVATILAGTGAWADFVTLIRTVSEPITTAHNFTPGAVAYQLGIDSGSAALIQTINLVGVAVIFLASIRWSTDESSYLVAVIASQLVSPILWDHYAMLLLLPVAYLLSAGRWWALAIPLVTAWPLVGITPPAAYPIVFWVALVATFLVGLQARDPHQSRAEAMAA